MTEYCGKPDAVYGSEDTIIEAIVISCARKCFPNNYFFHVVLQLELDCYECSFPRVKVAEKCEIQLSLDFLSLLCDIIKYFLF